jgi:protein tyrosine phosphatase (PTP) superfamily phosphohydrolase (DUF442 family)
VAHGVIGFASRRARATAGPRTPAPQGGTGPLRVVDERLWRGAAPTLEDYRQLAAAGIHTVIDLRAEPVTIGDHAVTGTGLRVLHIPLPDGHAPTLEQARRFVAAVGDSPGPVYVHCAAGIGRTGSMCAVYLIATGRASPRAALRRCLEVGPLTPEQVAFVLTLDAAIISPEGRAAAGDGRPSLRMRLALAAGRALDAPRQLWHRLT